MSYTNGLDKPSDYFNTVLYTGNGSTQSITGVNFQPDFNWIKHRNGTSWHTLTDSVRGISKNLFSNETNAEVTNALRILSFDSDGLTVGNDVNNSGNTYVAWNWLADNTSGSSNTDGSITSTVSANTTSGFSIVSYTGNGSVATVGHGLGVTPKIFIVKNRTSSNSWPVYSSMTGNGNKLLLNSTGASSSSGNWNSTSPTSSVFTVNGASGEVGASGNNYIAYCFAEKKGFSKFGSYTGNGSTNGTFVYTGFKPAFVMIKETDNSSTNWMIYDNKREIYNPQIIRLFPNETLGDTSNSGVYDIDLLSNGFKIRTTNNNFNRSGANHIYMAFAENPFVTSTGIPACAR
jgi:hypothetical protein